MKLSSLSSLHFPTFLKPSFSYSQFHSLSALDSYSSVTVPVLRDAAEFNTGRIDALTNSSNVRSDMTKRTLEEETDAVEFNIGCIGSSTGALTNSSSVRSNMTKQTLEENDAAEFDTGRISSSTDALTNSSSIRSDMAKRTLDETDAAEFNTGCIGSSTGNSSSVRSDMAKRTLEETAAAEFGSGRIGSNTGALTNSSNIGSDSAKRTLEETNAAEFDSGRIDSSADAPTNSSSVRTVKRTLEGSLVVRRPVKEATEEGEDGEDDDEVEVEEGLGAASSSSSLSVVDAELSRFAKKMPIFEPIRIGSSSGEKRLGVNLDLALYKAKVLTRSFRYKEAEEVLQKCISYWPEDGRSYVALGKILGKQSKTNEARAVYEKGCQATQGENAYIWQCWAVLENKMGNIRRARQLFDAATVADKKHIAAWHGWAVLELKVGNVKKARHLLSKGIKNCGGNEYIYQTLAMLEAKANRYEQARYLFRQATKCNPKSCASWLAWAQLEVQQENYRDARQLFEKSVEASPKNRFAWHVWGVFEASVGNVDKGRKLLKIGHALNPRDPVLLQSLGLLEYKHSAPNFARALFRKAAELDPRHQPVWIAWGWMEWKEGNIKAARELYQKALSINSTSESAARCLQAWGVLEQRVGNLSAARRLFRSSLNINSQSYVTWMTWASLEEDEGNSIRAEEIRNLYFQQRTEVVDEGSWVTGVLDIIDPAIDSIKKLLNINQNPYNMTRDSLTSEDGSDPVGEESGTGFDLDGFISEKLSLDASKLDIDFESKSKNLVSASPRKIWRASKSTESV